jgi:type IV secretion system protein VirD4
VRSDHLSSEGGSGEPRVLGLAVAVGLLAVAVALIWLIPMAAMWASSGHTAHISVVQAISAVTSGRVLGRIPGDAYPPAAGRLLPGALGFWTATGLVIIAGVAGLVAVARALDVAMSRPAADGRWWQLRGRRPHEFARFRTARDLIVARPRADRIIVGYIGRPKARLAVSNNMQMAVLAAPRTGKSSGLVIPALLEHEGPVITTSVRTDVVQHTVARRRQLGHVWVWDPFGSSTDAWDLLDGCENWEHALLVARWLGRARQIGEGINQDYFDQEAEGLVAPYLHAAALTPDVTATGVYEWILKRDEDTAARILADVGAADARARLKAVYAYTERQRDGIIGTAAVQLKAYGHPAAARTARRGEGFTPEALFEGPNTLYIVAGREHQQLLAPLVVTMIAALLYWLSERENRTGEGLRPQAVFALDETASIAPIQDLPQILATSLGSGARFLTVWHSVAQIRRHFGIDAAAEILALSQAKVFMGSITDQFTRQEVVDLMGQRQRGTGRAGHGRDVMTAQALQRTTAGEGLLVNGDLPPVIFRQRRHYLDPDLRRLKGTDAIADIGSSLERTSGAESLANQREAPNAHKWLADEFTPDPLDGAHDDYEAPF